MANQVSNIGCQYNLIMRRGADFIVPSITFQNADLSPVDLTGCTFAAEMRRTGLSADVALQFTVTPVDLPHGIIRMSVAAAATASVTCGETQFDLSSQYVWDMRMTDANGIISTPLWGTVNVLRQVQHA
jgi:hypothetical protein